MHLRIGFTILFLCVLWYILSQAIQFDELQKTIAAYDKRQFVVLFAISFLITILKSWRLLLLLKNNKVRVPFWDMVKIYSAGQATSPFPGGEAGRSVLLKQEHGVRIHKSSGPILTQTFLEIAAGVCIVFIGSIMYEMFVIPAIMAVVIFGFITAFLVNRKFTRYILEQLSKIKLIKKHSEKIELTQENIRKNIMHPKKYLPSETFIKTLGIALSTHILGGLLIWIINFSFGNTLDIFKSIYIYSSTIVLQAITIIPGGLGVTEGGMAGMLLLYNIDVPKALAIVLIFRFVTLVFNVLVGIIFLALFYMRSLLFHYNSRNKYA